MPEVRHSFDRFVQKKTEEFHDAPHVYFWGPWILLDDCRRRRRRTSTCTDCVAAAAPAAAAPVWFLFRYQIKFTFKVSGDQRAFCLDASCVHNEPRRKSTQNGIEGRKNPDAWSLSFSRALSPPLSSGTHCVIHSFHSHCSYPLRM